MAKQIPDRDRIESLRKELGFKDPGIFEKSVYAFNLLSELLRVYPGLIFKGGTSILLYIFPPARLSIDIDILLPVKERAGLKDALVRMVSASEWFDAVEEDLRHGRIPKAHYKFKFASQFSKIPQYVLLDVVFTEHPYKKLVEKDISKLPLIFSGSDMVVRVPTPEGLLGDKMTAISPKTMGIPLNEKQAMEVLKQVIDLGELFKIAFARIVYMASVLKGKESPRLIKNVDISLIQGIMLPEKYKILERLKVISPEAYFYWTLAVGAKN